MKQSPAVRTEELNLDEIAEKYPDIPRLIIIRTGGNEPWKKPKSA